MIEYRNINPEDTLAVTEYALRALRVVAVNEPLHVAPLKVREAVSFFAKDASGRHFNLAAFENRICVGAIAAFTAEMMYFERQEAHIMFCHASVPGIGWRLIREMMAWMRAEPRIRRVTWLMNKGEIGDRMARAITQRLGFDAMRLQTLVSYK